MVEVYWACLVGGVIFSLVALIAGDFFSHGLDAPGHFGHGLEHFDYLNPTTIVAGITAFGGAGIVLTKYADLAGLPGAILSFVLAVGVSVILHLLYVRPMRRSENSVAFSMHELPGHVGQITIPVPEKGYGEVMIRIGASNICEIAASHDGTPMKAGDTVVVTEVRGDTLIVAPFDDWKALAENDEHKLGA